jgi:hypothetical protein
MDSSHCTQELIREKNYTLTNLAQTQLGETRAEIEPEQISGIFWDFYDNNNILFHCYRAVHA